MAETVGIRVERYVESTIYVRDFRPDTCLWTPFAAKTLKLIVGRVSSKNGITLHAGT